MAHYKTEKEILIDNHCSLFQLENGIETKKYSIDEIGEMLPGMLHLNRSPDLVLSYFNSWALERFEKSVEEIQKEGLDFMVSLFEPEIAFLFSKSLIRFISKNDNNSSHGFFQKLRFNPKLDYEWMFTTSKLFMDGSYIFSYSSRIQDIENNSSYLLRALDDNLFLRKNYLKYQQLTLREKEIVKLVAKGFTSKQIAEILYISKDTVSTHRKNITKKLELKNINDWIRYYNAFPL